MYIAFDPVIPPLIFFLKEMGKKELSVIICVFRDKNAEVCKLNYLPKDIHLVSDGAEFQIQVYLTLKSTLLFTILNWLLLKYMCLEI